KSSRVAVRKHACCRAAEREASRLWEKFGKLVLKGRFIPGGQTVKERHAAPDPTYQPRPPPGAHLSSYGPRAGPLFGNERAGAIGVPSEGDAMPIGIAYPVWLADHYREPAQTFRLVVNKTELPGAGCAPGGDSFSWVGRPRNCEGRSRRGGCYSGSD